MKPVTTFLLPFLALAVAAMTPASHAADVTLVVTHARDTGARVYVQLCTEAEFLKRCALRQKAEATDDTLTFLFKDVPPGAYAATAFQDVNDDARLGRNGFGAPNEPWAVSNGAKGMMGPPAFQDARFTVGEGAVSQKLRLDD